MRCVLIVLRTGDLHHAGALARGRRAVRLSRNLFMRTVTVTVEDLAALELLAVELELACAVSLLPAPAAPLDGTVPVERAHPHRGELDSFARRSARSRASSSVSWRMQP